MDKVAVIRFSVSYINPSRKAMWAFLILYVLATVNTFQGLASILSCLESSFQTIGAFKKDDKRLRQAMFFGTLFWLLHNIWVSSPVIPKR